jgi:hypothetical protein
MKTLIITILLIAGAATAETIIVPRQPNGYKVIEKGEQICVSLVPTEKVEYEWIKVWKTKSEIRREKWQRQHEIYRIKQLRRMNRRARYQLSYIEKLPPLRKWKWIRVKVK